MSNVAASELPQAESDLHGRAGPEREVRPVHRDVEKPVAQDEDRQHTGATHVKVAPSDVAGAMRFAPKASA